MLKYGIGFGVGVAAVLGYLAIREYTRWGTFPGGVIPDVDPQNANNTLPARMFGLAPMNAYRGQSTVAGLRWR